MYSILANIVSDVENLSPKPKKTLQTLFLKSQVVSLKIHCEITVLSIEQSLPPNGFRQLHLSKNI